jgi:peptidoglycan/LPS O-acetylase OafA/YrhL
VYITIALFIVTVSPENPNPAGNHAESWSAAQAGAPTLKTWIAHYTFLQTYWNTGQSYYITSHLWSLCTEVQFYLFIGLLCLVLRRKAFYLLLVVGVAITGWRIYKGIHFSVITHERVDEIFAGTYLALVYENFLRLGIRKVLSSWLVQPLLFVLFALSCHPDAGPMLYFRPYAAAALVGSTLFIPNALQRWLGNKVLAYIAAISYALYVIHVGAMHGWLGEGRTTIIKYAKRPIVFAISWGLAHLSTFYFEAWWIGMGKKWTAHRLGRPTAEEKRKLDYPKVPPDPLAPAKPEPATVPVSP